jgi:hypothetical protein
MATNTNLELTTKLSAICGTKREPSKTSIGDLKPRTMPSKRKIIAKDTPKFKRSHSLHILTKIMQGHKAATTVKKNI